MDGKAAAEIIRQEQHFLQNILKDFTAADGDFRPTPDMMSVAQQIHHIARTIRWSIEGGFGIGFDMDFAKFERENREPIAFDAAMESLREAYEDFITLLVNSSAEELAQPMPPNDILGEAPRYSVIYMNRDHTAHHRGALSVYLRLLGRKPTMVYS